MRAVRALSRDEAQALWACSDRLADLNYERFQAMNLERDTTAAAVAYEGIQYTHLAPGVMSERELAWLDEHLRILSGLYGVLRPLDGVVPYRLEMQARLAVDGERDLYGFWGNSLYETLVEEGCDTIVNVASVEYARAVTPWVRPDGPPGPYLPLWHGARREAPPAGDRGQGGARHLRPLVRRARRRGAARRAHLRRARLCARRATLRWRTPWSSFAPTVHKTLARATLRPIRCTKRRFV